MKLCPGSVQLRFGLGSFPSAAWTPPRPDWFYLFVASVRAEFGRKLVDRLVPDFLKKWTGFGHRKIDGFLLQVGVRQSFRRVIAPRLEPLFLRETGSLFRGQDRPPLSRCCPARCLPPRGRARLVSRQETGFRYSAAGALGLQEFPVVLFEHGLFTPLHIGGAAFFFHSVEIHGVYLKKNIP